MKPWLKLVLSGYFLHSCFDSLYQDAIGKGRFIYLVSNGWVNAKLTVPSAIVVLICCFVVIAEAKKDICD